MKPAYIIITIALAASCSPVKNVNSSGNRLLQDIGQLSSDAFEGRKTGTAGAEKARNYIAARFRELGLASPKKYSNTDYIQDFSFTDRSGVKQAGKNVLASIPGKKPGVIVISAHYDHLGIRNNEIFNGADDNASGVSALLYFAEYFAKHKPEHQLIFAAFDAEETGLMGAKAFVADPPVPLSDIKTDINMDMISHNDKGELYVAGTFSYPWLKDYLVTTVPGIKVLPGHDDPKLGKDNDWTNQSDQGAFHDKKIPFLYFGVEDHKDYHKATDEFQNINQTFFTDASRAILEIIINLDKGRKKQDTLKERDIQVKQ